MDHFASEPFYDVNPDGGFLQPAPAFRMHPPIPGVAGRGRRAGPRAGDHGPSSGRPRPPRSSPVAAAGTRPFEGIRVADFTSFWAGPFFAHTLGMFGADVIHVESTARPDGARLMNQHPRTMAQWWERSPYFHATNTNKRGVTIDMSGAAGRDLARRLVAACDVMVENYSPRVMESFGLSWDEVREINPQLVMVRMPAFGLTGPWRDRTGFAMTMEQVSGMAWLTGFPEHDPGALFGPCDPGAGLHALIGLFVALERRRRTGEGRLVECPMVANALERRRRAGHRVLRPRRAPRPHGQPWPRRGAAEQLRLRRLGRRPRPAPLGVDRRRPTTTSGRALRTALGEPGMGRRPGAGHDGRDAGRRHDDLDAELAAWCAARTSTEVVDTLWPAGVPVAVCVHPCEQLEFPQLVARDFFEHVEHPVHGDSVHVRFPFRLPGETGPVHRRPAPLLGEHNTEVFGDLLGLSADELAALEAAGVIGT